MPNDVVHKRYVIEQVYAKGCWYLWIDDKPQCCMTAEEALERIRKAESPTRKEE